MLVRHETPADIRAIHDLTFTAFKPMRFSDDTEADSINALRADGDLTISLVAEDGGEIIGHIAFSPVTIDDAHNGWFGLGPIAVKPERQRRGVGKALICRGLQLLRGQGANGCALIGNPDIYSRVGFDSDGRLKYRDLEPEFVLRTVFRGPAPIGVLKFAPALEV